VTASARNTDREFNAALQEWYDRAGSSRFDELKSELLGIKTQIEALPIHEKSRLDEYARNRRTEQLRLFLQGFQIRRHKIKGIGPTKLSALTSYGVETAFDVTHNRVLQVPGFGPVLAGELVGWRKSVESRFVFNPNSNQMDRQVAAAIRNEILQQGSDLRAKLASGAQELRLLAAEIARDRESPGAKLEVLHKRRLQAEADLKVFGQTLPAIKPLTPSKPKAASVPRANIIAQPSSAIPQRPAVATGTPICPRCSSRMVRRMARHGPTAGNQFWGCSRYPSCKGTRPI